jgi:hypothetical protein
MNVFMLRTFWIRSARIRVKRSEKDFATRCNRITDMADADTDARSRLHATADSSTAAAHAMPADSTSIALVESWAFLLSGRISNYEWPSPARTETGQVAARAIWRNLAMLGS